MDLDRLTSFLTRALPGFEGLKGCERLTGGASRETYRITAKLTGGEEVYALRRALGDDAEPLLGRGPSLEAEPLLICAAHASGVPGPEVLGVLEKSDGLGAGFLMQWIDGETLGGRIARGAAFEKVRAGLARQCGEALARIHSVDVGDAPLASNIRSITPEALVRETYEAYRSLDEPQPMIAYTARWLLDHLPAQRPLALTHGDFRNGNLIVSPDEGLCAVLDWELAHIGDPMRDLGWLCTRSWRFGGGGPVGGFGNYDDLFAGYESIVGEPVDREAVRFWEVFGSFWWSIGCLAMGQSWRNDPEAAGVERPVIGRRSSECQIDCVNLLIPGAALAPEERRTPSVGIGLPNARELVASVAGCLGELADRQAEKRDRFLLRVAGNALAIVEREERFGASMIEREAEALANLLGRRDDLSVLRQELCDGLWEGAIDPARTELHALLRDRVLAQVLIDQPDYPGAIEAMAGGQARD